MSQQMNPRQPKHLNSHHLDTVMKIFAHPTSHNIRWQEVMSLIGEIGSVEEKHDGKVKIQVGNKTEVLHRPRHKDIDTKFIVDLRHMLKEAGYGPAEEPAKPGPSPV